MKLLIITSLLGDYSKIADEIEKELEEKKGTSEPEKESEKIKEDGEYVSMHTYDMLERAYDAKCDECDSLRNKTYELQREKNESEARMIFRYKECSEKRDWLQEQNKKLLEDLNEVAKQIKEINQKLSNHGLEKH